MGIVCVYMCVFTNFSSHQSLLLTPKNVRNEGNISQRSTSQGEKRCQRVAAIVRQFSVCQNQKFCQSRCRTSSFSLMSPISCKFTLYTSPFRREMGNKLRVFLHKTHSFGHCPGPAHVICCSLDIGSGVIRFEVPINWHLAGFSLDLFLKDGQHFVLVPQ